MSATGEKPLFDLLSDELQGVVTQNLELKTAYYPVKGLTEKIKDIDIFKQRSLGVKNDDSWDSETVRTEFESIRDVEDARRSQYYQAMDKMVCTIRTYNKQRGAHEQLDLRAIVDLVDSEYEIKPEKE